MDARTRSIKGATLKGDQLWAVTCYFNPMGYRTRRKNYRVFRRHLTVPLVTVELVGGDQPELGSDDAEILIQLRGGDVMWQKERMLNIAIDALPNDCGRVAWLDCDIVFQRQDWQREAAAALDKYPLVQLFRDLTDVQQGESMEQVDCSRPTLVGSASRILSGSMASKDLANLTGPRERWICATGVAWAGRREVLQQHGLYDARIMGGGDRSFECAAWGWMDEHQSYWRMNTNQRQHYLAWADGVYRTVQGRVTYIDGSLIHLWHGHRSERGYKQRYRNLEPFQFDPYQDIARADNGLWQWNTDKPEMHRCVRDYFASRNEDAVRA